MYWEIKSLDLFSFCNVNRVLHAASLFHSGFSYPFSLTIAPKESVLTRVIRTVYFGEHFNDLQLLLGESCHSLSPGAEAIVPWVCRAAAAGGAGSVRRASDAEEQDIPKPHLLQSQQPGGV